MPHYIITKHVADLARQAIKSFKETCDCILISCDDESPYEDIDFLKEMSDVYIRNEKNRGFAGNCNVGFRWILDNVKEECNVVCVNNDVEVFDGWLEEFNHLMDMATGDMIGGLGYRSRIVEGMPLEQYKTNPGSKYTNRYYSTGGRLEDWMFPGGFYMMRKSVLEDIGLLDEGFIHGGYEDIDFFLRCQEGGKNMIITPKVAYWHEEGATRFSEQEKGKQQDVEPQNLQYFLKKWNFQPHHNILQFMTDERINY